ncbi:putative lipoprotein [Methylorubrum extorquens]|uniref:Putative lipoprotein n=1 Tax=Methylorubrum extorquens TaxID=408 RepID=A0A2N9AMC8_METEX|nr:putative lipoprotein [Methylorubrum extorquens]
MRNTALVIAAGMLAMSTAAWAGDSSGKGEGRMQGSPNAAGFDKKDTTGTTGPGASSTAPGQEMKKQDGRMQGSPNAAGFKGEGGGSSSGSSGGR